MRTFNERPIVKNTAALGVQERDAKSGDFFLDGGNLCYFFSLHPGFQ